ncbi:MAG: ComEC/Rec2 family competence protein [Microcoleaceae cyanobacterium]
MNQTAAFIYGIAYILGLLVSAYSWGRSGVLLVGLILAIATVCWQWFIRKLRKSQTLFKLESGQQILSPAVGNEVEELLTQPPERKQRVSQRLLQLSRSIPKVPETVWLMAGLIAVLASLYLDLRTPTPAVNDVSRLIPQSGSTQNLLMTVRGKVANSPRVTRSGRGQFWFNPYQVSEIAGNDKPVAVSQDVIGKLYVTVPLLQATGLYPGADIAITGSLYKPQPPSNPGAFDFKAYLARQGAFAGLRGRYLSPIQPLQQSPWGWSTLQQRILQAIVGKLGVPEGSLLSAIVLGRRAVDLPYDIRDAFVQVGLAHVLAASGFHVSLLLGTVLTLTRRLQAQTRLSLGSLTLLGYVGLTGGSASVLRAALMGGAALIGLVLQRQVKSLNVLFAVAIVLLLWNPQWIWDLGFQFSFLATIGLLVTAPAIVKRLKILPPTIATLIAVPVAAAVWTLPLQLYTFKVVSPYSILVNILTVPFIVVNTLGGMISAAVALIIPTAGGAIAGLLHYPLVGLIQIVQRFAQLPGNSMTVGAVSEMQLIALYTLYCIVWAGCEIYHSQRQDNNQFYPPQPSRVWLRPIPIAILVAFLLIAVPAGYSKYSRFQVTVLNTPGEPILLIEDQGEITLVNSGGKNTARYTVLPVLQQQGINQIDWSVATHSRLGLSIGWQTILEKIPVEIFYDNPASKKTYEVSNQAIQAALEQQNGIYIPLAVENPVELGSTQIELIDAETPMVKFLIRNQIWMLFGDISLKEQEDLIKQQGLNPVDVLWWSGRRLDQRVLQLLRPKVAIASSESIDPETIEQLYQQQVQVFWVGRDGALQWTPSEGFSTHLSSDETDGSFL